VLVALAILAAGATTTVAGDDPCELARLVPEALADLGVPDPGAPIRLVPSGGVLTVTMSSTTGATLLQRRVPLRTFACAATADGVALVVERFVRDIGGASATPELPTLATSPADEGDDRPFALSASAHGLVGVPVGGPGTPIGGQLAVRMSFGIPEIAVEFGGLSPTESPITLGSDEIGTLTMWSVFALAGGGACLTLPISRLCGSVRVGFERLAVEAAGPGIFAASAGHRFALLLAPGARYELEITKEFGASIHIEGLIRPVERPFAIEDASEFTPPLLTATFGLGLWVRFY